MKTILVVDDSKTARLTLKRKLDLIEGVQVEMADSGEAAIELLKYSAAPDLIFMDVLMGNMSGYEAAATILKNPAMSDVPIVMCTSKDAQEDRDEAARCGAKGFIIKPISDEALAEVWRDLVVNRVRAVVPSSPPVEPVLPQMVPSTMPKATQDVVQPQVTPELEALVRQMVEQISLQRAEEVVTKVVHVVLGEHLQQIENFVGSKISTLTSSLAELSSAQTRAQAELHNAQHALPNTAMIVDERAIADSVARLFADLAAQEASKRSAQDLSLQTRLEQKLPMIAEQAAHSAANSIVQQALGSHFAMMDERLNLIQVELATLKSGSPKSALDPQEKQALFGQFETQIVQRLNERLPSMVTALAEAQLAAHVRASDEKFKNIKQELSAGIQAVSASLANQAAQPKQAALQQIPQELEQQLLSKMDELQEQRFHAWSSQMDAHFALSERAVLERFDEKMNEFSLQARAIQNTSPEPYTEALAHQGRDFASVKLALGVAALGVVLALIALLT